MLIRRHSSTAGILGAGKRFPAVVSVEESKDLFACRILVARYDIYSMRSAVKEAYIVTHSGSLLLANSESAMTSENLTRNKGHTAK